MEWTRSHPTTSRHHSIGRNVHLRGTQAPRRGVAQPALEARLGGEKTGRNHGKIGKWSEILLVKTLGLICVAVFRENWQNEVYMIELIWWLGLKIGYNSQNDHQTIGHMMIKHENLHLISRHPGSCPTLGFQEWDPPVKDSQLKTAIVGNKMIKTIAYLGFSWRPKR